MPEKRKRKRKGSGRANSRSRRRSQQSGQSRPQSRQDDSSEVTGAAGAWLGNRHVIDRTPAPGHEPDVDGVASPRDPDASTLEGGWTDGD